MDTHATAATRTADPVVTEIVRNAVIAITGEMKTNLMRTAYNTIIYEALDFTTGLFTAEGRDGVDRPRPADVHSRHGRDGARQDRAFRPRQDGAGRHPHHQRRLHHRLSHLNHVTLTVPVFHQDVLAGLPAAWRIGSISAARWAARAATSIPKGCRSRCSNTRMRGVDQSGPVDIIRMNVRIPHRAMGDLRAQVDGGEDRRAPLHPASRPLWPRRRAQRDPER